MTRDPFGKIPELENDFRSLKPAHGSISEVAAWLNRFRGIEGAVQKIIKLYDDSGEIATLLKQRLSDDAYKGMISCRDGLAKTLEDNKQYGVHVLYSEVVSAAKNLCHYVYTSLSLQSSELEAELIVKETAIKIMLVPLGAWVEAKLKEASLLDQAASTLLSSMLRVEPFIRSTINTPPGFELSFTEASNQIKLFGYQVAMMTANFRSAHTHYQRILTADSSSTDLDVKVVGEIRTYLNDVMNLKEQLSRTYTRIPDEFHLFLNQRSDEIGKLLGWCETALDPKKMPISEVRKVLGAFDCRVDVGMSDDNLRDMLISEALLRTLTAVKVVSFYLEKTSD